VEGTEGNGRSRCGHWALRRDRAALQKPLSLTCHATLLPPRLTLRPLAAGGLAEGLILPELFRPKWASPFLIAAPRAAFHGGL
jgi:hypothetical protein